MTMAAEKIHCAEEAKLLPAGVNNGFFYKFTQTTIQYNKKQAALISHR